MEKASAIKEENENNLVYTIDQTTQIEFLPTRKTIIVIDKDRFLVCKQLLIDNAPGLYLIKFLRKNIKKKFFFCR